MPRKSVPASNAQKVLRVPIKKIPFGIMPTRVTPLVPSNALKPFLWTLDWGTKNANQGIKLRYTLEPDAVGLVKG